MRTVNPIHKNLLCLVLGSLPWTTAHSGFFDDIKGAVGGMIKQTVEDNLKGTNADNKPNEPAPPQPSPMPTQKNYPSPASGAASPINEGNSRSYDFYPSAVGAAHQTEQADNWSLSNLGYRAWPKAFDSKYDAMLYDAMRQDKTHAGECQWKPGMSEFEFQRRITEAYAQYRSMLHSLKGKPSSAEMTHVIEAVMENYDFRKKGFPLELDSMIRMGFPFRFQRGYPCTNAAMKLAVAVQFKDDSPFGVHGAVIKKIDGLEHLTFVPMAPDQAESYVKTYKKLVGDERLKLNLLMRVTPVVGSPMEFTAEVISAQAINNYGKTLYAWDRSSLGAITQQTAQSQQRLNQAFEDFELEGVSLRMSPKQIHDALTSKGYQNSGRDITAGDGLARYRRSPVQLIVRAKHGNTTQLNFNLMENDHARARELMERLKKAFLEIGSVADECRRMMEQQSVISCQLVEPSSGATSKVGIDLSRGSASVTLTRTP